MTDVSPETVEDLVELARDLVSADRFAVEGLSMRAAIIVDRLPAPVDPDLLEVVLLLRKHHGDVAAGMSDKAIMKSWDATIPLIHDAIKRGRILAGEAQSEWGFKPCPSVMDSYNQSRATQGDS